jgi:hypothetical protein
MSAANHLFLPWVQPHTSATAPDAFTERLAADQAAAISVRVDLAINTSTVQKNVRLYGPGDVTGIDPLQIVRLEPKPSTADFEPNYFPFVEFDRPDFRGSSARPGRRAKPLRPWLVVVVVRQQPGVQLRPASDTPLPVLGSRRRPGRRAAGSRRVAFLGARADHWRGAERDRRRPRLRSARNDLAVVCARD